MISPLARLEGKYEILEKIQEGGMGAIYKVRHLLLDEVRVIKVMRPHLRQDPSLRERFLAEGRAAARLKHPNIARIIDCTIDEEGVAYLVMEFIPGWTLGDLLRRGELLPVSLCLEIAKQSLAAIGHMHHHKMVHRDIAPDNLILGSTVDEKPRIKLIDLGIAKATEDGSQLTDAGVFVGKFRYAAPELFDEVSARSEPRSDLYSLALVLYELMTLQFPIAGTTSSSLIAGHLFRPPLSFEISDPSCRLPDGVRQALLRGLAKTPQERFADAAAFADALSRGAGDLADADDTLQSDAVKAVLRLTTTPRPRESTAPYRLGSTQASFNAQFAPIPTPAPHPILVPDDERPTDLIPSVSEQLGPSHPLTRLAETDPNASTVILLPDTDQTETDQTDTDRVDGETPSAEVASGSAPHSDDGLAERTATLLQEAQQRAAREDITAARQLLDHLLQLDAEHSGARRLQRALETLTEVQLEETRRTEIIQRRQDGSLDLPQQAAPQAATTITPPPGPSTRTFTSPAQAPPGMPPAAPPPAAAEAAAHGPADDSRQAQSVEQDIATIRQMQQEGRIGSALEALQRSVQTHGGDPRLNDLRSELGVALLAQDAEQQSDIDPFSTVPSASSSSLIPVSPIDLQPEAGGGVIPPPPTALPDLPAPAPVPTTSRLDIRTATTPSAEGELHPGDLLHSPDGTTAADGPNTPVAELTLDGRASLNEVAAQPAFDETTATGLGHRARGTALPAGQNQQRSMLIGGIVLVLLFGVLGLFLSRYRPSDEPAALAVEDVVPSQLSPGFLELDLRPWGEIESLLDQNQEEPTMNPSRISPVLLSLPPGTYQAVLRYPPDDITREVTLQVKSGEITEHREVFRDIDSEAYFRAQNR